MPGKVQPIMKYDTKTKTTRKLKPAEVRAVIMEGYGLKTQREYEKFYDIMRNKLRVYQAAHSGDMESARKFLYTTAKSRIKYGSEYEPSERTKRIFASPAISSGRITEYYEKQENREAKLKEIKKDFQNFIDTLPPSYKGMATKLYNKILANPRIPVKNYQDFLDDLAKKYKAKREENGEVVAEGAVGGAGVTYESFNKGTVSTVPYLA